MIDVLQIADIIDRTACTALCTELRAAGGGPAGLLGRDRPVERVRRVTRVAIPTATGARIRDLLIAHKPAIEAHFGLVLGDCEEPQFLHYQTGDFFVAHQDGNTPLVHDDSRFRKISVVLFLSPHSEEPSVGSYGGGALVLHGPYLGPPVRVPLAPAPGTLVAFRAETTHEVTSVTHGERFTIVCWFR